MVAPSGGLTPREREWVAFAITDAFVTPGGAWSSEDGARLLEGRLATMIRRAKADAWDERGRARPAYSGPLDGHYPEVCGGWEDCRCASYPNPYREAGDHG